MFIALLLAVTSVSCISIFTDRLQKALLLETQEFLGGDLKYESNEKLLPSVLKEINYYIFLKSEVTSFASMISAADNMQLSSVKAVDSFYPLIGHVELEDESSQGKQYLESPPPRNHVWIDKRLKELLIGKGLNQLNSIIEELESIKTSIKFENDRILKDKLKLK